MRALPTDGSAALVVVDLQRYYLDPSASYVAYQRHLMGKLVLREIHDRATEVVLPNVASLLGIFRARGWPVVFLGLSGQAEDRSDLIPVFRDLNLESEKAGFPAFYPLRTDPLGQVAEAIAPTAGEAMIWKTSFSGFNSSDLHAHLQSQGVRKLVMTGICTSLCVETTARDGIDHGYEVVMVEDAQADFDDQRHYLSLRNSAAICGGEIVSTAQIVARYGTRADAAQS